MADDYQLFVDRWTHPDERPVPSTPASLDQAQEEIGAELPSELRDFLLRFGPVHTTIELLNLIIDEFIDLSDVSGFHTPEEIVSQTVGWRARGLPVTHVAFARDSQGNLFCFEAGERDEQVWFFDHDFNETECLDLSFSRWISRYAHLRG